MADLYTKFTDKFKSFFGSSEDDMEDEYGEYEGDRAKEESPKASAPLRFFDRVQPQQQQPAYRDSRSNAVNRTAAPRSMPTRHYDNEVLIAVPYNFRVTQQICDQIKAGKTVICNLEKVEDNISQRVIDYILGATYALGGTYESINDQIFVVTPSNTQLTMRTEEAGMEQPARPETQPLFSSLRRYDAVTRNMPLDDFDRQVVNR